MLLKIQLLLDNHFLPQRIEVCTILRYCAWKGIYFGLGPVYMIPDSYRRAATFVSDKGAVYITTELSDIRHSMDQSENHFTL